MDNASYHSGKIERMPTTSWRKAAIQDWLMKKEVEHQEHLTRPQLLEVVKKVDIITSYVIDKIAEEAGHRVLRLQT